MNDKIQERIEQLLYAFRAETQGIVEALGGFDELICRILKLARPRIYHPAISAPKAHTKKKNTQRLYKGIKAIYRPGKPVICS